MNRSISLIMKAIRDPFKTIHQIPYFIIDKYKLTEYARARGGGERVVIENWQSARESRDFYTLAHIQRYEWVLPYLRTLRCLDLGCGSGYGAHYLARNGVRHVTGVDISSDAIEFANRHYKLENLEFIQMDALNLKLKDDYFDSVISFDVLEHINEQNHSRFISEIARVLKSKGAAYIGCPNTTVAVGRNIFHRKELTSKEFETLLRRFFRDVRVFGQDLVVNGTKQKQNWHKHLSNISYQNLIIVKSDCDLVFGLLAICREPRI